jgi:hypothetical protein
LKYSEKSLREDIEMERGCCEAEVETKFNVSEFVPLEGDAMLVILSNKDYSEGILNDFQN